ncbi:MAG: hypothetical protein JJU10_07960 [Idiomarina sp.]|nr:hypothetical protein [Idiomarina sp.]
MRIQGFSLLELMLVTGMLSLMAGVGVHSLHHWQARVDYQHGLDRVLHTFLQAQRQAQRTQQDTLVGVRPDCVWLGYEVATDCAAAVFQPSSALTLSAQFNDQGVLRFSAPRGMAGFSAGRLILQHQRFPTHQTHVIVSTLGRVRVCQTERLLHGYPRCA